MSDQVNRMLESHKFSPDGSIWAPETLQQVRDRLEYIDAHECDCDESPHRNALHDLANDDVPVLLKVIEAQAAEHERLRGACKTLGGLLVSVNQMALDATSLHHLIGEDGDGDWAAVWENLAGLGAEVERLREHTARLERLMRNPHVVAALATVDPENAVEVEVR